MSDDVTVETPEQAEARIRTVGSRRALDLAGDVIGHVRGLVLDTDGRTESGEVIRTDRTPLHTRKVDDADEAFAQLLDWVSFWAETLDQPLPSAARVWRARPEHVGFPAGTTLQGAFMLVRLQSLWLLARHDLIAGHEAAAVYQADVMAIVFSLRAKYPTAPKPPRLVHPRPCPECGEPAVRAEWRSADVVDVDIRCEVCGHEVDANPIEISRWLA